MTYAIEDNITYLRDIVLNGGPLPHQYTSVADAFSRLHAVCYREVDGFSEMEHPIHGLESFLETNRDIFRSVTTMQGFAFVKPRGYAGDFEMIERIYDKVVSPDEGLARWDRFFHEGAAPKAVRNRAQYIHDILDSNDYRSLLSLGCGSGRDLSMTNDIEHIERMTLVDADCDAIANAKKNLNNPATDYTFLHKNVFRLKLEETFDIVWSAGLFDYLNTRRAVFLLKRVRESMADGSRIVIGNFSKENNPSRPYMELVGEWRLIHRSEQEMAGLMTAAGFDPKKVTVESDETGVNLFANAVK